MLKKAKGQISLALHLLSEDVRGVIKQRFELFAE
jgi:hypothetical protein